MFTKEELQLIDKITLNAIANGYKLIPTAYDPTPTEYKMLFSIRNKLELN